MKLKLTGDLADWREVKVKQGDLLRNSDYLLTLDYQELLTPECLEAVKTWRNTIRNIDKTFRHPSLVVWPQKPVIEKR